MNAAALREQLSSGESKWWQKAYRRQLDELVAAVSLSRAQVDAALLPDIDPQHSVLIEHLLSIATDTRHDIERVQTWISEFQQAWERSTTATVRNEQVLALARLLGASGWQLWQDRRALRRDFGHDAVVLRCQRRIARREQHLAFTLDRLAALLDRVAVALDSHVALAQLWRVLDVEELLRPLLSWPKNPVIRKASFACVRAVATHFSTTELAMSDAVIRYAYRAAMDRGEDVWMQCEAIDLLYAADPGSFLKAAAHRLSQAEDGDDLFVRRHVVAALGEMALPSAEALAVLETALSDRSPHVRQAILPALRRAPTPLIEAAIVKLARRDEIPAVRGAALLALTALAPRAVLQERLLDAVTGALREDEDAFVQRVALQVAYRVHEALQPVAPERASEWAAALLLCLAELGRGAPSVHMRRWAASAHETLWVASDADRRRLARALRERLQGIQGGGSARLPADVLAGHDTATIGRVLAVLAQSDYGLALDERSGWVHRWQRFGFRWWRFLYEMRHPASDKRQAHSHVVGRSFEGDIRAPGEGMAELSETKVPGEPLYIAEEGGWRPYLPLPDELVSALGQGPQRIQIFTAQGVTELCPPQGVQRWRAWFQICLRFAPIAGLRNWRAASGRPADAYAREIQQLGFRLRFRPHDFRGDPSVQQFFPALLPLPLLDFGSIGERFMVYFGSVYQNNLRELMMFLVGLGGLFFIRHYWLNFLLRGMRARMPLVIGGWGTRGKSGTERLKAALFNALGFEVLSKTSGCEAMFVYSHPYAALREFFLYRPYDKATIWEQMNVLRIADRLGAEVFLWECMGLTPAYVAILQRQWMRDDLSTITNTYPDHEDLQGPAGINIPQVMTEFIAPGSTILTTEEAMLPILADATAKMGGELDALGWLEAGLIAPDIMARIPYEEHPYNVALVVRIAERLGCNRDFALKAMADKVIADLGVLKTYPVAPWRGRRLVFVMGNSANERHGCLGNWVRLGFDRHDPVTEPGTWITTVVNNRADRIARSRVFASILVNDIQADRHFLIGTDLHGLQAFMRQEWQALMDKTSLWDAATDARPDPAGRLQHWARRLRVATTAEELQNRTAAILAGLGQNAAQARTLAQTEPAALARALDAAGLGPHYQDILRHQTSWANERTAYEKMLAKVTDAKPGVDARLDTEFRALLTQWFFAHIVVIEDPFATGNEINARVCDETPPGFLNRIMGMQNIKGTGLDFAYSWQRWEQCFELCRGLASSDESTAAQALDELSRFEDFNLLCAETVERTLANYAHAQTSAGLLLERVRRKLADKLKDALPVAGQNSQFGLLGMLAHSLEALLDAGDAVRRRRGADAIYRDLVAERISYEQAILRLQELVKRQKGGWLVAQWRAGLARWRLRLLRVLLLRQILKFLRGRR